MRHCRPSIGPYKILGVIRAERDAVILNGQYLDTGLNVMIRDFKVTGNKSDTERAKIVRELNILKGNQSNFTLRLFDVIEEPGHIFIFTERGSATLKARVDRYGPVKDEEAKRIISELVLLLEFLHHDLNICHKAIHADNIILDKYANVRIAGFGFSQQLLALNQTFTTAVAQLFETLPPEVVQRKPYTRAVDVWEMGCVIFYLVTGRYPFVDISWQSMLVKICTEEPVWPSGVDSSLVDLLKKMLQKNPADRIKSEELSGHPYFAGVDFTKLKCRSKGVDDARIDAYLGDRGVADLKDATARAIAKRELEIEDMKEVGNLTPPQDVYRPQLRKVVPEGLEGTMRILAKSVVTGRSRVVKQQSLHGLTDVVSDTVLDGLATRRYEQST